MSKLARTVRHTRIFRWLAARRTVIQASVLVLLSYGGIYLFLSAAGRWRPASGGVVQWEPYGASFHLRKTSAGRLIVRGSFVGFAYAPLIALDRTLVHSPPPTGSPEYQQALELDRQLQQKDLDDRNERPL